MDITNARGLRHGEDGMGIIEIVVALFVLAIVAIAFLPLLVQGLKQSARNTTLATATQLVNQEIELARDATCATDTIERESSFSDPRGVQLRVFRAIGPCPSAFPGTFEVFAQVTRDDTGVVLAEATTLIYQERG